MVSGNNGDMQFLALDVDSSGNMIAGGRGNDNQLLGSIPKGILFYYESTGNIKWAKWFTAFGQTQIVATKFLNSANSVIIHKDDGNPPSYIFSISIMNNADGTIAKSLVDYANSHYGVSGIFDILVVSSDRFLITMSNMNKNICLLSFEVSTLSAKQAFVFNDIDGFPISMIRGMGDYGFISGYSNSPYAFIIKFDVTTLSIYEQLRNSQGSSSQHIAAMSYITDTNYQYIFGCSHYTSLIVTRIMMSGDVYNAIDQYRLATSHYCYGIMGITTDTAYMMLQNPQLSAILFASFTFSSNMYYGYIITAFYGYSSTLRQAIFISSSVIYYAGHTRGINKAGSGTSTFQYDLAFIMTYDQSGSCITSGKSTYQSGTLSAQSNTWQTYTSFPQTNWGMLQEYGFTATDINIGNIVSQSWCTSNTASVGFTSQTSNQLFEYTIGSPPETFELTNYISQTCTDATFSNTISLYSYSGGAPPSIQFDGNFTITVESNNPSHAGQKNYYFNLKITQNGATAQRTFSIKFIDSCGSIQLTKTALSSPQTYYVGQGKQDIVFYPVTSNLAESLCGPIIYLIDQNGSQLDSTIFTWTLSNLTLAVNTNDLDLVGTTITIRQISYQQAATTIQANFNFDIKFDVLCTLDIITAPAATSDTYTLGLSQQFTPGTFTNKYSNCANYTFECWDSNDIDCLTSSSQMYPFVTAMQTASPAKFTISFTTFQLSPLVLYIVAKGAGTVIAKQKWSLNVYQPCLDTIITPVLINDVQYKINTDATYITFADWTESYGSCTPFIYTVEIDGSLTNSNGYITFDPALRNFTINATTAAAINNYNIKIIGKLKQDGKFAETSFIVYIQPNNKGAPQFSSSIQDVVLKVPETKEITIPSISDEDGDGYSISVTYGKAQQFVTWKNPKLKIYAKPQYTGTFSITIRLTDDNQTPLFSEYIVNIEIIPLPPKEEQNETQTADGNLVVISDSFFSFSPKEISVGKQKIKREKLVEKLNATVQNVGMQGEVTIKFTKNLLYVEEIEKIREYRALILKLIPSFEKSTNHIKDWSVISLKNNLLTLKVDYHNPMAVSINVRIIS